MAWTEFNATPSWLTAEPVNRAERVRTLREVTARGFVGGYRAVRISRFPAERATVWNVVDEDGNGRGQAAPSRSGRPLPQNRERQTHYFAVQATTSISPATMTLRAFSMATLIGSPFRPHP